MTDVIVRSLGVLTVILVLLALTTALGATDWLTGLMTAKAMAVGGLSLGGTA
jgi:hypothetical protein